MWEMKPRTIPQKTSWLLMGTEQVTMPPLKLDGGGGGGGDDDDDDDDDDYDNDDDNSDDDNDGGDIYVWMYKTFTVTPHTDWQ